MKTAMLQNEASVFPQLQTTLKFHDHTCDLEHYTLSQVHFIHKRWQWENSH